MHDHLPLKHCIFSHTFNAQICLLTFQKYPKCIKMLLDIKMDIQSVVIERNINVEQNLTPIKHRCETLCFVNNNNFLIKATHIYIKPLDCSLCMMIIQRCNY